MVAAPGLGGDPNRRKAPVLEEAEKEAVAGLEHQEGKAVAMAATRQLRSGRHRSGSFEDDTRAQ